MSPSNGWSFSRCCRSLKTRIVNHSKKFIIFQEFSLNFNIFLAMFHFFAGCSALETRRSRKLLCPSSTISPSVPPSALYSSTLKISNKPLTASSLVRPTTTRNSSSSKRCWPLQQNQNSWRQSSKIHLWTGNSRINSSSCSQREIPAPTPTTSETFTSLKSCWTSSTPKNINAHDFSSHNKNLISF